MKFGTRYAALLLAASLVVAMYLLSACGDKSSFYHQNASNSRSDLFERAVNASEHQRTDSALAYYEMIINSYRSDLPREDQVASAGAFNNAGYIYFFKYSDYLKAYTYFMKAHEIAEHEKLSGTVSGSLLNIGNIYGVFDITDEAEKMYKDAFFLALDNDEWATVITSFLNLAYLHFGRIEFSSMSDVMDAFGNAEIPDTVPHVESTRRQYDAIRYIISGETDRAIEALKECVDSDAVGQEERRISLGCEIYSARLYQHSGRLDRSTEMFRSALAKAVADGENDFAAECWEGLANNYAIMGLNDSSQICRLRRYEIRDSMVNIKKFSTIRDYASVYQQKAMTDELQAVSQEKRMREHLLTLAAISLLIVAGLGVGIWLKNRELSRRNLDLFVKYRELSALQDAQEDVDATAAVSRAKTDGPRPADTSATDCTGVSKSLELGDSYIRALYGSVLEIMRSDAIFDPSFSADTLAKLTDSKTRYISHAIGAMTGKNFSTLLAEYRIKEASRRLADTDTFGHLTLEAISESVGFKSRTYFATTFKKVTGLSPREYQKIATEHPEKLV